MARRTGMTTGNGMIAQKADHAPANDTPAPGGAATDGATERGVDIATERGIDGATEREIDGAAERAIVDTLPPTLPVDVTPPETPAQHVAGLRHDPAAIRRLFETGEYPYSTRMRAAPYEQHLQELQRELLKAQRWVEDTGERIIILFEGRDAAGKGGTIKRFTEHMNPRTARVVALQKPTEREQAQWYFQRYIAHWPSGGELVLFDRSWYNRAGVERVMGFCSPQEYLEFMRQCPELERMLVRSGVRLFKYWFSVSREEQRRRFQQRQTDPLKQWKLSPIDLASLDKWD
ncbi:MAG: polyphosphate kinase 2, partial [Acetobacteraceae bacterium]